MFGKLPDSPSIKDRLEDIKTQKSTDNTLDNSETEQKTSVEKAFAERVAADNKAASQIAADRERANKAKIESDLFFNLMMEALLKSGKLKNKLTEAAEQVGFDSLSDALNKIKNSDGQSPLQYLIQKQDFAAAKSLMDYGATLGPVEQAVLDIASDSKAGREFGLTPPVAEKLHPVKYFGLVLGVEMTSKDGVTFSQYGHIAPTYQLMTDAVTKHAQKNPDNQDFKDIADAFSFSNKTAAFSNSTPQRNPMAGHEMASRIQSGKITTIPISCEGHAMGLSIVPDGPGSKSGYLVYTNRGLGAKSDEYGTQIYRLDDLDKVNSKFINNMMNGFSDGTSHDAIKKQIAQVTDGKPPIHNIEQKGQKVDNCTIANSGSNVHGILLCQQAVKKGGFENLEKSDMDLARKEYKQFKADMKADKAQELIDAIKKNPQDSDLINLGKGYLQRNKADPNLKADLEKALGSHAPEAKGQEQQQQTSLNL